MSIANNNGYIPDPLDIPANDNYHYANLSKTKIFPESDIREIEYHTYFNAHNLSVLHLARVIDNKPAMKIMKAIITIHETLGYMPPGLMEVRREILEKLLMLCKCAGIDNYDALNGAF